MKKYLSDFLTTSIYGKWLNGAKVIITAPTGMGKTTFVLSEFLPYCNHRGKKVAILCNRRLLREQYLYDLAERYFSYAKMEEGVSIFTYQQLAEQIQSGNDLKQTLKDFDVIVMDEVHYFCSDADFNAIGTYILLQNLIKECFFKTVLMLTATPDEVLPLIEKTYKNCAERIEQESGSFAGFEVYKFNDMVYDFRYMEDFTRFHCYYHMDEQSLCQEIALSEGKTIIFIDDKKQAEKLKTMLMDYGKLKNADISMLNADVLEKDKQENVVVQLAIGHQLIVKILITTSVLDNGVSIHDSDVKNVVIATESKTSLLQMLGRVRAESGNDINLFVYPRESTYYHRRIEQMEERMQLFESVENAVGKCIEYPLLAKGWFTSGEEAENMRNALVVTNRSVEYFSEQRSAVSLRRGEIILAVNYFAKEKIGNLLLEERTLYRLALRNPAEAAKAQIAWLGKGADELTVIDSTYMEKRKSLLVEMLMKIQDYSLEQLSEAKEALAKEFRRDFLKKYILKAGSFSTEKLKKICAECGLEVVTKGNQNRNKLYSVMKIEECEEDE